MVKLLEQHYKQMPLPYYSDSLFWYLARDFDASDVSQEYSDDEIFHYAL